EKFHAETAGAGCCFIRIPEQYTHCRHTDPDHQELVSEKRHIAFQISDSTFLYDNTRRHGNFDRDIDDPHRPRASDPGGARGLFILPAVGCRYTNHNSRTHIYYDHRLSPSAEYTRCEGADQAGSE